MTPRFPALDRGHASTRNSKGSRYLMLAARIVSYGSRLIFGDNRFSIRVSSRLSASAFALSVSHVVLWRSEEQVRRTNTRRVVAFVANMLVVKDGRLEKHVGNAMGQGHVRCVDAESTVSMPVFVAGPNPAITGFVHPFQEPRLNGFQIGQVANIVDVHGGSYHELLCAARAALQRCRAFFITARTAPCH